MKKFQQAIRLAQDIELGADQLVLIAGPCVIEQEDICLSVASTLKKYCSELEIGYVFKASFDKANRTSGSSFRSIGFESSLQILQKVKDHIGVPVLTDVHESHQVSEVSSIVDVLQIPAFLCRQTDLLVASGKSGKAVNIKRGQFMAPEDMKYAVSKVNSERNQNVCLTERGASFGYHNLVVDMRALPIMRQYSPVIFDVTHSVQQPGGAGGSSGGQREFSPYLARAAGAVGVDGFFVETHPDPKNAKSDGPNMVPLAQMDEFLPMLKEAWKLGRIYT